MLSQVACPFSTPPNVSARQRMGPPSVVINAGQQQLHGAVAQRRRDLGHLGLASQGLADDCAGIGQGDSEPLPASAAKDSSTLELLVDQTLAVPVFREDGQRSDAEALGHREVVAAAIGIVGSSDLQDVGASLRVAM